ncbi:MAG: cytochrome P450 [Candidatus Azotimanducaceae bacterium]|jgi:cytochrome P450
MSEMVLDPSQLPDPETMPIEDIDVSHPILLQQDIWQPYFKRLRQDDPVHYCKSSVFGAYWSITKFNDIMEIEKNHEVFSSDRDITIFDQSMLDELGIPKRKRDTSNFIAMDPPVHDDQRKAVQGVVAPRNLSKMEGLIRQRVINILESLPLNEEFSWVEKVSIELTTQMLATLFDFPFEDRHKLPYWSDVSTSLPELGIGLPGLTREAQEAALEDCLATMRKLWEERANLPADNDMDLLSMLAHNKSTHDMDDDMFLGNLILLIVGGNDTTRNSITGGVLALNENPAEYAKLRANPKLIPSMVSEIIRWQTPLSHMRRTATQDIEFRGKQIKKGDKVIMWYISGNRDDEVIENADDFIIDRANPRHHVSFGFGIHRCMGNRLAEMQLRVLWEEITKRFDKIEVVGQPERIVSNFIKGYTDLNVKLHPVPGSTGP